MPIEIIEIFLDCKAYQNIEYNEHEYLFSYSGHKLLYELIVDLKKKTICISGDFEQPFSYSSLFETCSEWDTINIETEPEFYGDQKILVCRKNHNEHKDLKTLMVMKWPNGELSIWPYNIKEQIIN